MMVYFGILIALLFRLNENFYDTVESIKDLKKEDYDQWKFPKRVADLLIVKTAEVLNGKISLEKSETVP